MDSKILIHALDAGAGDCILIVDTKDNTKVLIDSGPAMGQGKKNVEKKLKELLGDDNSIELAIVTHNDNDHIGGYKSLLSNNTIKVKKFLFNDISSVKKVIKDNQEKISFNQDTDLSRYLEKNSVKVEFALVNQSCKSAFTIGRFNFNLISPTLEELENLNKHEQGHRRKVSKENEKNTSTISDHLISIKDGQDVFTTDISPTNRSSITFFIQVGKLSFLFLADIHAEIIEKYFTTHESNRSFNLIKVSHHGSERNTSQSMLKKIHSDNFLFCSDGNNSHGHPSTKTLARIVHLFPKSLFHFSSNSEKILSITAEIKDKSYYASEGMITIEYAC